MRYTLLIWLMGKLMLTPIPSDRNISATTGVANKIGDYRGPIKNSPPNPGKYWWGAVLVRDAGWRHVQAVGREATEKAMIALGAK